MNHYSKFVSRLQSRIAKRAADITSTEHWKLLYKAQRNFGDMESAKKALRQMEKDQKLDKEMLREFEQAAYVENNFDSFVGDSYEHA